MALTDIGMSPWPVMKMIGIGVPARATAPAACRARSAPGAHVEHQASRHRDANCPGTQGGRKALHPQSDRSDETLGRFARATYRDFTRDPRKLLSTRAKRPKRDDPNKKSLLTKHCLWLIGSSVDFEKGSQPDGHRFKSTPCNHRGSRGVALNLTTALLACVRNTKSAQDFRTLSMVVDSTRRKSLIRWQKRAAMWEHGFESRRIPPASISRPFCGTRSHRTGRRRHRS